MSDQREWVFLLRLPADHPAPARLAARVLKSLWRSWGCRCVALEVPREMQRLRDENAQLRDELKRLQANGRGFAK